jgi:hypothetical protein
MARIVSPYITDEQFEEVTEPLNLELGDRSRQELVDRAAAALEGALSERFIIPLVAEDGSAYKNAPAWCRNVVLSAIKAKIRQVAGADKNRNIVVEAGERFIDLHKNEFDGYVASMLSPKKPFGFKLAVQAQGAITPIQSVGLGRARNNFRVRPVRHESDPQ